MSDTIRKRGFTLIEMLVVIGIAALMTAMVFPIAKSLTAGNRAMTCATRLHQIGVAAKLYSLDEGSAPPYYPVAVDSTQMVGTGLLALADAGYLRSEATLNCPSDVTHKGRTRFVTLPAEDANGDGVKDDFWATSYCRYDPDAGVDAAGYADANRYSYLCSRGMDDTAPPDLLRRQLAAFDTAAGVPSLHRGSSQPDDDTVVTWCPAHYQSIEMAGKGIYQVLFWDGSVLRVPGDKMRSGVVPAWQIEPIDAIGTGN